MAHHKPTLPAESFRSVLLEMVYRGDGLHPPETKYATGSGFFYRVDGADFLVTARHNFTGWDDVNDLPLSTRGVGPTHINIGFWPSHPPGGYDISNGLAIRLFQLPLYQDADDDGAEAARWIEHPIYGPQVDVAALKVRIPHEHDVFYQPWEPTAADVAFSNTKLWVTQTLAIVGYPYGLNGNNLPLWVRGSIASEPELLYGMPDGNALPLFVIDARTREGQSGSPVLLFRHPGEVVPATKTSIAITQGVSSKLLGIYSGRVRRDADLGFVWRMGVVDEICRGDVLSTHFR